MLGLDNVSDNDKDFVCNLLTNTFNSGTNLSSTIYLIDATKINDSSSDLATSACCNNYYSFIYRHELFNANI